MGSKTKKGRKVPLPPGIAAAGDATQATKRRRKRKRAGESEGEGEEGEVETKFESLPRTSQWTEEDEGVHYLLPLKGRRGLIHQPAVLQPTGTETYTRHK